MKEIGAHPMRPRTCIALAILFVLGVAYAASVATAAPPMAFSSDRNCDCRAEIADLNRRLDAIEQRLTQTRQAILNTLDEVREQNELVRSTQRATVSTSVPAREEAATYSGPHLQAYVAPASYTQYQDAAGQLPSTSVGGQVATASPAYTYTDSYGRTVVDYPVSIGTAPATPVVAASYQQPAYYQPRRTYSYAQPAYYGGYSSGYSSGGCISCR